MYSPDLFSHWLLGSVWPVIFTVPPQKLFSNFSPWALFRKRPQLPHPGINAAGPLFLFKCKKFKGLSPLTRPRQVLNFPIYSAGCSTRKKNYRNEIAFSLMHSQSWIIPLSDWELIPSDLNIHIHNPDPLVSINCLIHLYSPSLSTTCLLGSASDSLLVPAVYEWWSQPAFLSSTMRNWRGARGWVLFVFSN